MSYIVNALKRAFSTSPPTQQQASAGKDLVEVRFSSVAKCKEGEGNGA
jgi:hypothetical protein